ncbi:MAG: hypothetical protein HYY84_16830 [Deltaproteobacteria bacterium]|nr:hypothetical protein [Deltaproteobacteria bacterium]
MKHSHCIGFVAVFAVTVACGNAHPLRGPSGASDEPDDYAADAGDAPAVSRDANSDASARSAPNEKPVARVSVPTLVNAGDEVTLDGSTSASTGDAELTFAWRVTPVDNDGRFSLRDHAKAKAVARFLTRGRYRVTLVVTESGVDSNPAEAMVEADDTAVRPIANAGVDQEVALGTVVTLDGAGSHDPNGDPLTFSWTVLEGGALPGFDEHGTRPQFTASLPHATYRFALVVNDGMHASASDDVVVRVKNSPPELSGIVDRSVHSKTIPLSVTATDKDGDALTFVWDFVSKPSGSAATIDNPTARETSFVVDALGLYEVRVKVSDGVAESIAVMRITPYNAAPGIDDGSAGPAEIAHRCAGNRCTATTRLAVNVFDSDDRDLSVAFTLKSAPNAKVVATFCGAPTVIASQRPMWTNVSCAVTIETAGARASDPAPAIAGNYTFEAKVTDSFGESRSLEIAAVVKNEAPIVTVIAPGTLNYSATRGAEVPTKWTLTATTSVSATVTDPENGLKSTAWRVAKAPQGATVTMNTPTSPATSVTISMTSSDLMQLKQFVSNDYTLELQATDINDQTKTAAINLAVVNRAPRFALTPSVARPAFRHCVAIGVRHECWVDVELTPHSAIDDDGDTPDVLYAVASAQGHAFSATKVGAAFQIREAGSFRFGAGPFEGKVGLSVTAVDLFGETATVALDVHILNRKPPAPRHDINPVNEWTACDAVNCHAVMAGDVIADYASAPNLDDGDELRAVGASADPTVGFARKSGKFFGCEPTQTCYLGMCRDNYGRWRQSASIAFSSRWVVSYPASGAGPAAVAAVAEDWSGAVSDNTPIPVSITDSGSTPGCTPRIDWESPKAGAVGVNP